MLREFKAFVMRGNVVDMAVGVIIGVAFGKIVSSLVSDVLMPPVGLVLGGMDFSTLFINLSGQPYATVKDAKAAGAPVIAYGVFLNTVINFVIVALVIFLLVRQVNRMTRPRETPAAAPTTKECPYCVSTIPLKATRCAHCTSELAPATR